eukprot:2934741-Amphidinium_carterae.1
MALPPEIQQKQILDRSQSTSGIIRTNRTTRTTRTTWDVLWFGFGGSLTLGKPTIGLDVP